MSKSQLHGILSDCRDLQDLIHTVFFERVLGPLGVGPCAECTKRKKMQSLEDLTIYWGKETSQKITTQR